MHVPHQIVNKEKTEDQFVDIKVYSDERFGSLRVIERSGAWWFVVADISHTLGENDRLRMMNRVETQHKAYESVDTGTGGKQHMAIVSATGLATLIDGYQSARPRGITYAKLQERKRFIGQYLNWIHSAVLGLDVVPQDLDDEFTQPGNTIADTVDENEPNGVEAAKGNGETENRDTTKALQVFDDPKFGSVRMLIEDGDVLFCGYDVAKALGYAKPRNAISTHCRDALKRGAPTSSGEQEMLFIYEADVYRLITRSQLPEAVKFEKWIFEVVVPSLRRTGFYMTPERLEAEMSNPDNLYTMAVSWKKERDLRIELQGTVQSLQPKAELADQFLEHGINMSFRDSVKIMGVRERVLMGYLREKGFLYKDGKGYTMPYANYCGDLFVVKESYNSSNSWQGPQTLLTPKGRAFFHRKLKREGLLMDNAQMSS